MSFTFDETIAFWDYIKMLQRSLYPSATFTEMLFYNNRDYSDNSVV
jgi:hypothetical protein